MENTNDVPSAFVIIDRERDARVAAALARIAGDLRARNAPCMLGAHYAPAVWGFCRFCGVVS